MSCRFTLKFLEKIKHVNSNHYRTFHLSTYLPKAKNEDYMGTGNTIYEPFEPGHYAGEMPLIAIPTKKQIKKGMKLLREESHKFVDEVKESFDSDPIFEHRHGEVHRVFSFGRDTDPSTWLTLTDADEGFGYSKCQFTTSRNGCGLFHGTLSTQVAQDGMSYRSGFCALRAPKPRKSFLRKDYYDWGQYTHLVMRVRGDGRTYHILLGASGHYDTSWYNAHGYALFTRGGPYWQIAKIPFSKFFLTHKGYIQDKQWEPEKDEISSFGITLMDSVEGPFQLEIDYIGLGLDILHDEIHAYEMYKHEVNLGDC